MPPKAIRLQLITALLALWPLSPAMAEEEVIVGAFSRGELEPWEEKRFEGLTRYRLVERDGATVLHAVGEGSASGLYRKIEIDLTRTPYLNWSWKVIEAPRGNDERSRAGDDYGARVYIVVSGGLAFWNTIALNYVWSANQGAGAHWPNAYTANAHMVAVRGAETPTGQWRHEKRNVREDLKRYFGRDITRIDAVALMSDGDNTGQRVEALYGDIRFTAR